MAEGLQTRAPREGAGEQTPGDAGEASLAGPRSGESFGVPSLTRPGSRIWWIAAALWLGSAACWTANPMVGFGLLMAGVVALWRRKIPTHVAVLAVPTAYVIAWCALGQLLALADVTFLSSRLGWSIGWVLVTTAVLAAGGRPLSWLAARRAGSTVGEPVVDRVRGPVRWTFLPAGLFAAVAAVQSSSFDLVSRWITSGTDSMQLILLIQQMAREGALITTRNLGSDGNLYGQAYPKGLHWVITAALGPAVDPSSLTSAQTLELYIRTFGGFVWLTVAAMFCVAAGLFLAAMRRRRQSTAVPIVAVAWLLLGVLGVQQFGAVVVLQGAFASGAAVACLWVLFWVSLAEARLRIQVAVLGCAFFVTANSWPPVLVVVAMVGIFMLWPRRRRVPAWLFSTRFSGVGRLAAVGILGVLAVVITMIPVTALLMAGGAQHASATGGISGPSLPALTLEILLFLVLAVRFRIFRRLGASTLARSVVGAILGAELVWLAMSAAAHGDIGSYYPLKVVWFATIFGWPLVALAMGIVVVDLGRRAGVALAPMWQVVRRNRVLSATAIGVGGCLLAAVVPWGWTFAPLMAQAAMGNLDRPALISIVTLPDPPPGEHYVPYLLNRSWEVPWKQSYIAAKFLAFRFDAPYLQWATDEPDCAIIRTQSPAIFVSIQTPEAVTNALRKAGCALTSWQTIQLR